MFGLVVFALLSLILFGPAIIAIAAGSVGWALVGLLWIFVLGGISSGL